MTIETPTETDAQPAQPHDSGPATGPRRRRWLVVALAALAVVTGAVAVFQSLRAAGRDADVDERDDVRAVASALAEGILSYDYRDIEGSLDRVQRHLGGEFADIYEETFRTVQAPVITQLQAVATAEVQDVYVTEVDDGRASAVVLIDQTVNSTAGLRSLTGTFLQMDLVERDGTWVVETIPLRISSRNETLTPTPGETTSTTTTATTTTSPG